MLNRTSDSLPDTFMSLRIKNRQNEWELAVWLRGLNLGSVTTWRDGMGWEAGGRSKREGTRVPVADSC